MPRKRRQGRPLTFKRPQRRHLAELIRQHGVRGAQEVAPLPISVATLTKIAREFAIVLKKGRRPRQEAHFIEHLLPSSDSIRLHPAQTIELDSDAGRKAA